jgi:hypothetical protein
MEIEPASKLDIKDKMSIIFPLNDKSTHNNKYHQHDDVHQTM